MVELMTVTAAVLAIGAGGRPAGRRLWSVIREVVLERSFRKTMLAVLATAARARGCAQVIAVRDSDGCRVWQTYVSLDARVWGQGGLGG